MAKSFCSWPTQFWTVNFIELFERAAYYAVASFMVIYFNENLGMSAPQATFLNGSLLWGIDLFYAGNQRKFGRYLWLSPCLAFGFFVLNIRIFAFGEYFPF